jgi:hypothetical protein
MESASRHVRAGLRAAPVFTVGFAAVLVVTTAVPLCAADFDWSNPGESETAAVKTALREDFPAGLEALLYDGLETDQRLPEGRARVPLISLAVMANNEEAIRFLLAQGADIDAMSTGIVEDSAAFNDSLRRLSK